MSFLLKYPRNFGVILADQRYNESALTREGNEVSITHGDLRRLGNRAGGCPEGHAADPVGRVPA
ncbi:hypothetical protein [Psychromarinibacter sp. S121]|uniref:hypothetical protein n=1 Tax=Psychromarinibacter sp. S121 TaxID=3415127 RepID=UPI003C7C2328